MTILVTGGAGYVGSVIVDLLRARGERVVVLDNLSRGHRAAVAEDVPFYCRDVGDRSFVEHIAREHDVEACIHCAAFAYVGESVTDPARYFQNNAAQSIGLLDALLKVGVRQVICSSTCAIYGEPECIPIPEEHPQRPVNPYGWSKFFLERILDSYEIAYDLKFVVLRYFNAAGATKRLGECHDPEPHLIPNVLAAAQGRRPHVTVFGGTYPTPDGTAIRDYVHVADLAVAHVRALDYLRAGNESARINLGIGRGYSVLEVIDVARRVTNRPIEYTIVPPRTGDPAVLIARTAKAETLLGWRPKYSCLDAIISTAWEWALRHPAGYASG